MQSIYHLIGRKGSALAEFQITVAETVAPALMGGDATRQLVPPVNFMDSHFLTTKQLMFHQL